MEAKLRKLYKNGMTERNTAAHNLKCLGCSWTGHGDVMLVHSKTLLFISSPHISQTTTTLALRSSEGTHLLIMLSGGEPIKSQCYDGQG